MKRRRRVVVLSVGIVLTIVGMAALFWPGAPRLYRTTALPTSLSWELHPEALNDHGQVVGRIHDNKSIWHLFMWDRSSGLRDLGLTVTNDCDINNAGQIAGTAVKVDNEAFVMDPNGAVQFLGSLGGHVSQAHAINDRGQVVGRSAYASGQHGYEGTHAFLWDPNDGMTDLGTVGGLDSEASAITEAGQVFGFFEYSGQGWQRRRRPCYWDPERYVQRLWYRAAQ